MKELLKYIESLAIIAIIALFSGCTPDEQSGAEIDVPKKVQIELFTRAYDYNTPSTRAGSADENTINKEPYILVFKKINDTENYEFVEAVKSYIKTSKTYVILNKQTEKCKLLILANPQTQFYIGSTAKTFDEETLNSELAGTTLTQACSTLLTEPVDIVNEKPPFTPGKNIPMSIIYTPETTGINANTTIGTESSALQLSRAVAKIIIKNTASNFVLEGITTVADAPSQGLWYNDSNPLTPPATINSFVEYQTGDNYNSNIAAAVDGGDGTQSTETNPVYLHESVAGKTYIIIKGVYQGRTCYYKLELADDSGNEIDILRNHNYIFTITKVNGVGHDTVSEAKDAPAYNNTQLHVELLVTNESLYEITAFDDYYLAVSNSVYHTYSNDEGPFEAFSFLAYKSTGTISGHINLWDNLSFSDDTPQDFVSTNDESSTNLRHAKIKIGNTYDWDNDEGGRYNADYFEIRMGDLKKSMRIRKEPAIPAAGKTLVYYWWHSDNYEAFTHYLLSGEVVTGDDWIQLLPSSEINNGNTNSITVDDGKIHIKILPGTVKRTGTVYLTTIKNPGYDPENGQQKSYRIKVDITQLAN